MGGFKSATTLERLQAITDAALAHLELEELLAELLDRIAAMLEVETCAVLLLDDETGELVARKVIGLDAEVGLGDRVPVGSGFAGKVAAELRPVVASDELGIKMLLGVPLLFEGRVIGVLHVGTLRPREFSDVDVELLQLVGDRISLAIEHARLFAAEREARAQLERVQAVTDAALAHLDLDELLSQLLQRIHALLDIDTCAILLLDGETNELVARAAVGIEEEVEQGVRIPVGGGFAGKVAAERRPVIVPDVDHGNVLNPILRQKGIKSLLGVPLIAQDEVVGVLHVGTLARFDFGRQHVELLQLVADRAALAIEKARLHEETLRLDQMKLDFVAVASHELRTPATAIYGLLTTLRVRGDALPEETRAKLQETAWEQSDRLRRLIEQLLDLSRLDARRIVIQPRPLVLRHILEDVIESAGLGGEDVILDVDGTLAVVLDPLVVERVIGNVVGNARRYGKPPIRVSAERQDRHIRIAIDDCGPGVPELLVPTLFERFERGSSGGAGLGLAIAKTYAHAHGGDLVYHHGPVGARFELVLPTQ